MEIDVTTEFVPLDFGATGAKEIIQNIRMILATPEFSCPMDRGFAWSPNVDSPINIAQARIMHRLVEAVRQYEPRAEITKVLFEHGDQSGILKPVVRVKINGTAI